MLINAKQLNYAIYIFIFIVFGIYIKILSGKNISVLYQYFYLELHKCKNRFFPFSKVSRGIINHPLYFTDAFFLCLRHFITIFPHVFHVFINKYLYSHVSSFLFFFFIWFTFFFFHFYTVTGNCEIL